MENRLIDADVQAIVDSNAEDISFVFPSPLMRAFKEDEEYLNHPDLRVFTHFTNLKMFCVRCPPSSAVPVTFLVAQNPKNKQFAVKEGQPLVSVGSEIISAPFDAEIVAFNHRLAEDSSLVCSEPTGAGYLMFANRKFPKKRKNLES